jgi:glucose/arabinose dehydrogenase
MWTTIAVSVLGLIIAVATIEPQACRNRPPESASPSPTLPPISSTDVLTTQDGVRFRVEVLVTNLEIPWAVAFAPDNRMFVTERPGRVRILDAARGTNELALTLDDVYAQGEAGVLGIAVDPDFAQNHFVYIDYSARTSSGLAVNRVVRYREVGGQLAERATLLDGMPAATIHDGGRLRFGPDGLLYATFGDANVPASAQDVAVSAGKILRINRDGTSPRTNPFSSPVFSYGHRNPQGIDWHPTTGDLWESEHGPTGNDEVNVIDSGGNYGWPEIQGSESRPGMQTPVTFYSSTIAPSGASFYRGSRFPAFVNDFFVAALRGTHIARLRLNSTAPRRIASQERLIDGLFGRIRDVIVGADGLLYFCTSNRDGRGSPTATDDRIGRLVPAS